MVENKAAERIMFHNVKKNVRFSTDILVMQVSFFSCRHCSLKKPGDDGITLGIEELSESSYTNYLIFWFPSGAKISEYLSKVSVFEFETKSLKKADFFCSNNSKRSF